MPPSPPWSGRSVPGENQPTPSPHGQSSFFGMVGTGTRGRLRFGRNLADPDLTVPPYPVGRAKVKWTPQGHLWRLDVDFISVYIGFV